MSLFFIAACGENLTDLEYMQRAKSYLDSNQLKAGTIELKNALNVNGNNTEARWLLGKVNVQLGDGASAEKELLKAQNLGLGAEAIVVPLARAYLLQNKLDEIVGLSENGLDKLNLAELKYLKSKAYIGLKDIDAAKRELKQAIELGGESPVGNMSHAFNEFVDGKFDESLVWIKKVLEEDGKYLDALILSGDIYLAKSKYQEAQNFYQEALNIQKNSPILKIALAIAQINNNQLDDAIKQLSFVLRYFPEDVTSNYYRALAAFRKNEYQDAQFYAEKVLNSQANHLESKLIAAVSSYSLKHYEKALKYISSFLSFIPDYESAIKLQTATLLALNQPEQAAKNVSKFKINTEQDGKMLEAIAISLAQSGDVRAGSVMLERAIEHASDKGQAYAQLGLMKVSLGDKKAGVKELEKAVELVPELTGADVMLIISHIKEKNFDNAIVSAKNLQEKQPTNPDGFTLEAIAQLGKKNIDEAKKLLKESLEIAPGNPNASFNLASLALEERNVNEARELYSNVLKYNQGNLKALLLLSDIEFRSGNQELGLQLLEEAKNKNKNAAQPRVALAEWYVRKKQPEKALRVVDPIIKKFPRYVQLIDIVAQAQSLTGKTEPAIESYHKLEKLLPKNADVQYQLSRLYRVKKDLSKAMVHADKALSIDANSRLTLLLVADIAVQKGDYNRAKEALLVYKKSNEANAGVYELEAKIALAEGDPKKAITFYRKAFDKAANNLIVIQLAKAYRQDSKVEKANQVLVDWLNLNPGDDFSRMFLADSYLLDNKFTEAIKEYELVNKSQPRNVAVINNLAWLQMQFENYSKALSFINAALNLAPDSTAILDTNAQILLAKGDLGGAIAKYEEAGRIDPNNLDIQFQLAKVLKQGGKTEKAESILNRLIDTKTFGGIEKAKLLLSEMN